MFSPFWIMKFDEKEDMCVCVCVCENYYGEWSMFVCVASIKDPHLNEVIQFGTPRVVLTMC